MNRREFARVSAGLGTAAAGGFWWSCASERSPDRIALAGTQAVCLDVRDWQARGDGQTDDTAAVQAAVDAAPPGARIAIPDGIYLIDVGRSIRLRSGVTLALAPRTVLRAIPTDEPHYAVLRLNSVSNVTVLGGAIEGERAMHRGATGEWGMGIDIRGSQHVVVRNMTVRACWGDGVYVGPEDPLRECVNVVLSHVICENNRRQGISVVACRGALIERCRVLRSNGTPPESGIDLEPNEPYVVEDVLVTGCEAAENAEVGIIVYGGPHSGARGIRLIGNRCHTNGSSGIRFSRTSDNIAAENVCTENGRHGIEVENNDQDRANRNLITRNHCAANRADGIHLVTAPAHEVANNTLVENECERNAGAGIALHHAAGNLVVANRCTGNRSDGIRLRGTNARGNTVAANELINNGAGVTFSGAAGNLIVANRCGQERTSIIAGGSGTNWIVDDSCRPQ